MRFRYQVLKALIEHVGKKTLPRFESTVLVEMFPNQSADIVTSCLHELQEEGLVSFSHSSDDKFYSFSIAPSASAYLLNLKELKHLKQREKWENRIYGFIAGVASTVLARMLVQWLQ
ncbi:hypothetical protein [Selenomonas sp. oral taxon 136]|uniref:hypothetical protein n=1 Tax=Selenomonas sp. oral taxon 136 TaxID=713030 RepID=UPI0007684AE3|nr:hypothetical protein [Selenomonas sp. oral taxon 136]AME03637.1 hypothetical protein AXE86_05890 [Selenomonas sp. oral taxon 136]